MPETVYTKAELDAIFTTINEKIAALGAAPTPPEPTPPETIPPTGAAKPTGPAGNWTLAFEDTFDGTTLDPSRWQKNWYNGTNNIKSDPKNIAVRNGNLELTLSDASTGAIVTTKPGSGVQGFELGAPCVWEARVLFPGNGTAIYGWPAFWLLRDPPGEGPCEIDVAEPWDGVMQTNYHCGGSNPSKTYSAYKDGKFHVWTCYRTLTDMKFYADGQLVHTQAKAAADNGNPQYALFNTGRTTSGKNNVYGAPSKVLVDYLRAWKPA